MKLKPWMKLMIFGAILLGVTGFFGGLYFVIIKSMHYIQVSPARMEGARAFALLVGAILVAFVAAVGVAKIVWHYVQIYNLRRPHLNLRRNSVA